MNVRNATLLVILLLFATAGCLSSVPSEAPTSPTGTPTPTPTPTEEVSEAPAETTDQYGDVPPPNQPQANKEVQLFNDWNRSVSMDVRVVRESTNESVHDETYDLDPGESQTAYDVADADPDGVEAFEVVVTARGTTERVSIETSTCYGDASAEIRDDGTLYVYYAVC